MLELAIAAALIGASGGLAVRVQRSRRFGNNEPVKGATFIANFLFVVLVGRVVQSRVDEATEAALLVSVGIGLVALLVVGFAKLRREG